MSQDNIIGGAVFIWLVSGDTTADLTRYNGFNTYESDIILRSDSRENRDYDL